MAIFERAERFDFSGVHFGRDVSGDYEKGFVARLQLKKLPHSNLRSLLFSCPYFSVYGVCLHAERDREAFNRLEQRAQTWTLADSRGLVYLLELRALFLSPYQDAPREMTVELPLNLVGEPLASLYAYYDGKRLGWIAENKEINCDFPFGALVRSDCPHPKH